MQGASRMCVPPPHCSVPGTQVQIFDTLAQGPEKSSSRWGFSQEHSLKWKRNPRSISKAWMGPKKPSAHGGTPGKFSPYEETPVGFQTWRKNRFKNENSASSQETGQVEAECYLVQRCSPSPPFPEKPQMK